MALLLDEVLVNPELPDLNGSDLFVEAGRVEPKVFVEGLVVLAVDVVGTGDDYVRVDEEGRAVEGGVPVRVGELEEPDAVVGVGHYVDFSGRIVTDFSVEEVRFGVFLQLVVVEPVVLEGLGFH